MTLEKRLQLRSQLRDEFMKFTGEDYENAEIFMNYLDDVREAFEFIRSGDSDCTGKVSEEIIAEFMKYMLF